MSGVVVLPRRVLAACPPCAGHGESACGVCRGTGLGFIGESECSACVVGGVKACEACAGSGERDVSAWIVPALVCVRCDERCLADERPAVRQAWIDEHASCRAP